jgi:hypothetical protein
MLVLHLLHGIGPLRTLLALTTLEIRASAVHAGLSQLSASSMIKGVSMVRMLHTSSTLSSMSFLATQSIRAAMVVI